MTIYLSFSCWRLSCINIVDYIKSSMRYILNSQNKYAFLAFTFLKALKLHDKIWNFKATILSYLKSSILYLWSEKLLFTSADIQTSYVNWNVSSKWIVFIKFWASLSSVMSYISSSTLSGLVENFITNLRFVRSQSSLRFFHCFNMRYKLLQFLSVK